MVSVGPRVKIPTCAFLDEGRMTAIQVRRVWGKRVDQLEEGSETTEKMYISHLPRLMPPPAHPPQSRVGYPHT